MRPTARVAAAVGTAMVSALCGVRAAGCLASADLSGAEAEGLLRAHNEWRGRVGVRPLRWSTELAAAAQARADRLAESGCTLEHGTLANDMGENLLRAAPFRGEEPSVGIAPLTPTQVVNAWGAEAGDYSPETNSCAAGRQCGHYTQLVWAATEEVGCGKAICPSRAQIWACDYRPAGNIQGQRPY